MSVPKYKVEKDATCGCVKGGMCGAVVKEKKGEAKEKEEKEKGIEVKGIELQESEG